MPTESEQGRDKSWHGSPSGVAMGALAGAIATFAMTSAMTRLFGCLPPKDRYPLPPTQITGRLMGAQDATAALVAHFGFGAIGGALYAAMTGSRALIPGMVYGGAVWGGSYLGWIPATSLLRPAHDHPKARNALMLAVHGVWGAGMVLALRELERAAGSAFAPGPALDADPGRPWFAD